MSLAQQVGIVSAISPGKLPKTRLGGSFVGVLAGQKLGIGAWKRALGYAEGRRQVGWVEQGYLSSCVAWFGGKLQRPGGSG